MQNIYKASEFAVNTLLFGTLKFSEALYIIKLAGFNWVEPTYIHAYQKFDEDKIFSVSNGKAVAKQANDSGLGIRAVAAHLDLGSEESVEKMKKRLDFAAAAGAEILITNATTKAKKTLFFKNIELIHKYAQESKLKVALENPGDGFDAILADGLTGTKFIKELGLSSVGFNYDVCNALTYSLNELDMLTEIETTVLDEAITHLHLKDMRRNSEGFLEFCPIGEGIVDYTNFFKKLVQRGRFIPLSLEMPIQFYRGLDNLMVAKDFGITPAQMLDVLKTSRENIDKHLKDFTE